MTDHEEIRYWRQGTDGFFLYLNGLRPVPFIWDLCQFMFYYFVLKREHAFLSVKKKQSKHIIDVAVFSEDLCASSPWKTSPKERVLLAMKRVECSQSPIFPTVKIEDPDALARSRRSDSGERCEVTRSPHLSPQSPSTFHRFLYFAPLCTI